jgi:hypothetical protein
MMPKQHFLLLGLSVRIADEAFQNCASNDWNQAGYDIVRIVKDDDVPVEGTAGVKESYHLLFGQVTKSSTHSLKLRYFSDLAQCIVDYGSIVSSIEIALIVPEGGKFSISPTKVIGTGTISHFAVYASPSTKWRQSHEHELITVYELDMRNLERVEDINCTHEQQWGNWMNSERNIGTHPRNTNL